MDLHGRWKYQAIRMRADFCAYFERPSKTYVKFPRGTRCLNIRQIEHNLRCYFNICGGRTSSVVVRRTSFISLFYVRSTFLVHSQKILSHLERGRNIQSLDRSKFINPPRVISVARKEGCKFGRGVFHVVMNEGRLSHELRPVILMMRSKYS